ncbi:hypothetical protein [Streptomyces sp. SID3343]|uniref:hypothetical protein n=1 Tax=Streptomyces sp. SID3343 TaxID=2690260 RepID=UPI0013720C8A|nr:hypothetical protein [Streptomyces sp. SID3343]MYW04734.1 hypothetical protein [Streptomyces sp. SID3343]
MNSFKGLGVCLVLGATTFAVANVAKINQVVLALTIGAAVMFISTFVASVWRWRWDRRMAGEGRRRRTAGRSAQVTTQVTPQAAPQTGLAA